MPLKRSLEKFPGNTRNCSLVHLYLAIEWEDIIIQNVCMDRSFLSLTFFFCEFTGTISPYDADFCCRIVLLFICNLGYPSIHFQQYIYIPSYVDNMQYRYTTCGSWLQKLALYY